MSMAEEFHYEERFIDWVIDHWDSYSVAGQPYGLLADEFHSDAAAHAGYKYRTGKQPRAYRPTRHTSEGDDPRLRSTHINHVHSDSRRYTSKDSVQENPALKQYWKKVDRHNAGDEYLAEIKEMLRLESWLGDRERRYSEEELWNSNPYHEVVHKLNIVQLTIKTLAEEYDLPDIDIDMLREEIQ